MMIVVGLRSLVTPYFHDFNMGKSMEFMGRPWFSYALKKHGNIFQATSTEHGLAWKLWDFTFL